ncbi:AAA family ATPase [Oerskovia jenensis]|uniref:Rad50/SbcC-type AAA domain-containing protein n=1 Tax=Oerskovia jenensis TaxID=162169 RepID=A0ABS2LIA2_9CELL|nr:AAA family ATPase [Oerskovia jenensis]MBM7480161.1 hypothetical protein [Oerskovia jenensis]
MRIISLTAENVKRLRAVDITPDGHVQVITGKNGAGKTSVLDAIWLALGGGPAAKGTVRPIRDGETKASVRLDLGDLVVTRTWTESGTTLKVESADGAKFSSPQKMLDDLVGRLSFDPLAFTQLPAKAQRDALLSLVELPFDPADLDRRRARLFDERTEIGRAGVSLKGRLDGLPPVDAPDEEVSSASVLAELRAAQDANREREQIIAAAESAQSAWEQEQLQFEEARARLEAARTHMQAAWIAVKDIPAEVDAVEIEQRLASVDEVNAAVRAKRERRQVMDEHSRVRKEYEAKTDAIAALDQEKADGLAAATFPIEGLGFDMDGVTYQGVPFSQASAAEQIRVSLAMAMALNPKLRVIRILDGSLLDADNLALVAEMATAQDYQVWIERVTDGSGVGIVIEDGEVSR